MRHGVEAVDDDVALGFIDAYRHIDKFHGDAKVSTWLTRIVINEALGRLRRRKRDEIIVPFAKPHQSDQDHEESVVADTETISKVINTGQGQYTTVRANSEEIRMYIVPLQVPDALKPAGVTGVLEVVEPQK